MGEQGGLGQRQSLTLRPYRPDVMEDISRSHSPDNRAAPRLALSLPGKFMATHGTYECILTNLSRTGTLIAVKERLAVGSEGFLRCGPIDHFMIVARQDKGLVGLTFEIPVNDGFVEGIAFYQDQLAEIEQSRLARTARGWIEGAGGGIW